MKLTPKERLDKISEIFKMSIAEIAYTCGYARAQAFYDVLNGKTKNISQNMIDKILLTFPSICEAWLLTGEGEMLKTEENNDTNDSVEFVRLLPVSAQGGSLNDFIIAVKDSDCEQIISPVRGADFAMSVAGDSMTPEYPSGAQILIKKINAQAFIDWGKVYVLDTCNGSIIKRIFPADDPDKVKCVSINSEYPPFEVSLEDVFGVYRVLLCMAVK